MISYHASYQDTAMIWKFVLCLNSAGTKKDNLIYILYQANLTRKQVVAACGGETGYSLYPGWGYSRKESGQSLSHLYPELYSSFQLTPI